MKERGILFSAPMVQAILFGRKTETRRIVKGISGWPERYPDPPVAIFPDGAGTGWIGWWGRGPFTAEMTRRVYPGSSGFRCPHGLPGDVLWVRETFAAWLTEHGGACLTYRASAPEPLPPGVHWTPSIFMPRRLSRITLRLTSVRVERLQDITEGGAVAEGCAGSEVSTPRKEYETLWDSINGPGSWDLNPWVWVLAFEVVR